MAETRTSNQSGMSRANRNKAVRQEALREQLANGGHLQHIIDISKQLSDLDAELEATNITRLKYAADIKLKLLNKYLPDLKAVEIQAEVDGNITISWGKAE